MIYTLLLVLTLCENLPNGEWESFGFAFFKRQGLNLFRKVGEKTMTNIGIDAGEIVLVDADPRGLVFYHASGAVTIVPRHVLKKVVKLKK